MFGAEQHISSIAVWGSAFLQCIALSYYIILLRYFVIILLVRMMWVTQCGEECREK